MPKLVATFTGSVSIRTAFNVLTRFSTVAPHPHTEPYSHHVSEPYMILPEVMGRMRNGCLQGCLQMAVERCWFRGETAIVIPAKESADDLTLICSLCT